MQNSKTINYGFLGYFAIKPVFYLSDQATVYGNLAILLNFENKRYDICILNGVPETKR